MMQTQFVTAETAPVDKPRTEITFTGLREIKRAMIAARAIVNNVIYFNRHLNARLVSRPGKQKVELYASDGHRLAHIDLTADRNKPRRLFDVAIRTEMVRTIANCTGQQVLRIAEFDDGKIGLAYGTEQTWQLFEPGSSIPVTSYDRILNEGDNTAAIAMSINRTAALKAFREMPKQDGIKPYIRLAIKRGTFSAWATTAEFIGPDYAPDVQLFCQVARCDKEIVFGMDRNYLYDTFRTMTGRTISISVKDSVHAIRISSDDGRERFVIMPAYL